MIKYIATILLIVDMVLGLYIWLEDHDNNKLRVIRLGSVVSLAVILLLVIFFFGA
jgi:hypothetical protein